jgi:hypothetical protein
LSLSKIHATREWASREEDWPQRSGRVIEPPGESELRTRTLTDSLRDKVLETMERTEHLIQMAPDGGLGWSPAIPSGGSQAMDLGHLLGHVLSCAAGFCAALFAAFPERLNWMEELRVLRVDHFCKRNEALERMRSYRAAIERGFECCHDEDLGRRVRTVFVPTGESLLTVLLGNLEHLISHKYQLFFYLKMLGIEVATKDLYRLHERREKEGDE